LHAESSQAFFHMMLAHTTPPLVVIHDGARSPTRASTQACVAAPSERITEHPLPSYAPDDTPMADLWRKTKKRATPNPYCKAFAAVVVAVDKAHRRELKVDSIENKRLIGTASPWRGSATLTAQATQCRAIEAY